MKHIFTTLFIFLALATHAQWLAKQSLPLNKERTFAASFTLNGKVYLVGGNDNFAGLSEVWEYDVTANTWTQKNNFTEARGGMTAFAIGGKGYVMLGSNYNGNFSDRVWEYDAVSDTWLQKANFPGGGRHEAMGFVIGNKAYVGTGAFEVFGPNSTGSGTYDDFWEYDPIADTWTQKSDMPGQQRGWAIGVALNGKGYAGLGGSGDQTATFNDFYEYDPATDAWSGLTNHPYMMADAMAFTLGNDLYVCGGLNFTNNTASAFLRRYDVSTDSWIVQPNMPAGITMGAAAITAGNKAFVGTGYDATLTEKNDWWQFTALCQAPVGFVTTTVATANNGCTGKIVVSDIASGCAPYSFSISANTGSVSSSAGNYTISNLCSGSYSVYVADANCCGITMSVIAVPVGIALGIDESNNDEDGISLFPNPNNGTFKISFDAAHPIKQQDVNVVNVPGQEIPATITISGSEAEVILDRREKGIYFVQINSSGKQIGKKIQVD